MNRSEARARFIEVIRRPADRIDLAEAALLVAAEEDPRVDVARGLRRIDLLAEETKRRLPADGDTGQRLRLLFDYLYGEVGLRGNLEDYDDPRNSLLHEVLERGLGIPITLALVCIEVGRRVGLSLRGVSFPGHFLMRYGGRKEAIFDPFDRGRRLTRRDCEELLRRYMGRDVAFHPSLLRPSSPRAILARLLNNLETVYLAGGRMEDALSVMDRLLALRPGDRRKRRQRALLALQLGMVEEAGSYLEEYLTSVEDREEIDRLRQHLTESERRFTLVN